MKVAAHGTLERDFEDFNSVSTHIEERSWLRLLAILKLKKREFQKVHPFGSHVI